MIANTRVSSSPKRFCQNSFERGGSKSLGHQKLIQWRASPSFSTSTLPMQLGSPFLIKWHRHLSRFSESWLLAVPTQHHFWNLQFFVPGLIR